MGIYSTEQIKSLKIDLNGSFQITSKEVGSKDFTFFFCSKLLASEKILWRKTAKKWRKTRKKRQKTIKNSRKTTKNRAKNALNSWKNVRIKPFLAQKRASKTTKNTRKQRFFLQIQGFCKFFTNDKLLVVSSINPYLYICRYIYNNNNNIIIAFIYNSF